MISRPQAQWHQLRRSKRANPHLPASVHAAARNGIQEVGVNSTLGSGGLLSSKPNLKQEPLQTALSGSHLYCLCSCPRGAAIYGAVKGARPAGWSRLFTGLACLSRMGGGEKKEETGRAGWDSMTYTEIFMKTSVSSVFTSHLPKISQQPILFREKVTPLGFDWTRIISPVLSAKIR